MLKSVLIANRGEIACRVIRTARRMGLRTIAVYSEADRHGLHVTEADIAVPIGPAPARESYLVIDRIIEAARETGAQSIHPGYGFLSENAAFAEACAEAGIVFIGPPPSAIRAMGLKDGAKALMQKAGVPVVPGYHGANQDAKFLKEKAYEIGYPVLIKAVAGGGGKGMKRVDKALDFEDALASAQREAQNAFGEPRVLIEKYIASPRHIEIQVFGDSHGNVVHLFERDCSLQRRHQKVIEEAPAPGMSPEMRAAMGKAAVEAARAVGYVGAGTVEFIADGSKGLSADRFYFMEMNTRLQVEHPVTEMITGTDLVEWQIRVASGEPLPARQEELVLSGHAVEARLYAEDPEKGFLPSTGRIHSMDLVSAKDIRVDHGLNTLEAEISPFYDPMIAKVIAHGQTRNEALDRLSAALGTMHVAGPRTNLRFLKALADARGFRDGAFDTGFIDRNLEALGAIPRALDMKAVALGALWLVKADLERLFAREPAETFSPWSPAAANGFLLSRETWRRPLRVVADGERVDLMLEWSAAGPKIIAPDGEQATATVSMRDMDRPLIRFIESDARSGQTARQIVVPLPGRILVLIDGRQTEVRAFDPFDVDLDHLDGSGLVKAPMHGKVVAVFVEAAQNVAKGDRLAVVEAMKMEHTLTAPADGIVSSLSINVGDQVAEGAVIAVVETINSTAPAS